MNFTAFRNNLYSLISSRGISYASFSRDIGIPVQTIARYLKGERTPDLPYVVKIAQYFDVSIDWILGFNGDKFDVMPQEVQDVATCYSLASPEDRRVIKAVLQKYKQTKE